MSKNYNNNTSKSNYDSKEGKDYKSNGKSNNNERNNYSNKKKNGNRSKGYNKGESYYDQRDNDRSSKKDQRVGSYVGSNDPQWYKGNPQLIHDASKIPFTNQLGVPVTLVTDDTQTPANQPAQFVVPGIMSLQYITTPGVATSSTDGVNIAATGVFQYIRKSLSTVASYAAADVMIYLLGIDEIFSMYSNIMRIFGIVNAYSAINLYYPKLLLKAGYDMNEDDFIDLTSNLNNYRALFNNLIYKASTLYLPTNFTVTSRHAWLFANYFTDADVTKSQIYIHRMMAYHQLDETISDQGSYLKTIKTPVSGESSASLMHTLLGAFNGMIEAYRSSDSMMKIAADMRRAYENQQSWRLAYCNEEYMTLPLMSKDVLSQIHNTTITYRPTSDEDWASWDVTQDVDRNIVICDPTWHVTSSNSDTLAQMLAPAMADKFLNFYWDAVTEDDILEATRNSVGVYKSGADKYKIYQTGVDVCVGATVYDINTVGVFNVYPLIGITTGMNILPLSYYTSFDWAPMVWIKDVDGDSGYRPLFDIANYAVLSNYNLTLLNNNVLASMWAVPQLGEYTGKSN